MRCWDQGEGVYLGGEWRSSTRAPPIPSHNVDMQYINQCSPEKRMLKKGTLHRSSGRTTYRNRALQTLVLMCGYALTVMLLSLAVALSTHHDYSGAFQGGYGAWFIASRRVLKGARRALYPSKTA